jgi:fructose-specific component phosphotransferase system IIB-like protein
MRSIQNIMRPILTAVLAAAGPIAVAQGMGGLANQALAPLGVGDGTAPGWFYYGVNAADRGLGYNGGYLTLGGFVPYAEDDLGGLWAADLRGHLSEYGGFFSNVGAVRKQFIGGTLLGFGVYWDYDGDLNQYPVAGVPGAQFGQFGHAYNQVGVSGEWLTDYGNIRSNGYIPVGTTAYTIGAPGLPFAGNYLLCQHGLDAALGGADLEVGAYIPGLADWAGMVSVGGYALGNDRYTWGKGTTPNQAVVPWFGGVYTRLDMTFLENWDFSLQANNDSYFDWTGFARLTYRMGGSRRRNVPDQVEQPMMRNEHIVRAHQTPIVALNPVTNQPWNVIHVDSAAAFGGTGAVAAPVQTLAEAQALATQPYDIVFVRTGRSGVTPYASTWEFQADNQILVGEGSSLVLVSANCGPRQFFATGSDAPYPVLTSSGTAITLRNGAIVDHFRVQDAPLGIMADASLTAGANVNDVQIIGTPGDAQRGIVAANVASGAVNFFNMTVRNTDVGLEVTGGAADVTFQGLIDATRTDGPSLLIDGPVGGTIAVNRSLDTLLTPVAFNQAFIQQTFALINRDSTAGEVITVSTMSDTTVDIGQIQITTPSQVGIFVENNAASDITFTDLRVTAAGGQAVLTQANDAASLVAIGGPSSLTSQSDSVATFQSNDDAVLEINLRSLGSALENATGQAIVLNGGSTGFLTVSESFLVGGAPGTDAANVTNTTPVIVTVPGP